MAGQFKYYFYSKTQEKRNRDNAKRLGEGDFRVSKVLYENKWQPYTEVKYENVTSESDSKLVAKGIDLIIRD